ncbi:hypothetical protein MTO96_032044, partial [Rhipicephalus appendiculatus]
MTDQSVPEVGCIEKFFSIGLRGFIRRWNCDRWHNPVHVRISWQMEDPPSKLVKWMSLLLFGAFHKQRLVIRSCFNAAKTGKREDYDRYAQQRTDLCLLDLYHSFLKSAPQVVLQIYIMFDTKDWSPKTVGTLVVALIFLVTSVVVYDIDIRRRCKEYEPLSWPGVALHMCWRLGIVTSRIGSMVLMAAVDDLLAIMYF